MSTHRRHRKRLLNAIALRMPRWGYTLASLLVIGGLFLAAETSPAGAAIIHDHIATITGFGKPAAVAVGPAGPEASTKEANAVYVADEGNNTIARFTSAGTPLAFECATAECKKYISEGKLTGTPSGSFGTYEPRGVAVDDETGEVFVSEGSVVDIFSGEGEYLNQITGTPAGAAEVEGPFAPTAGLAVYQKENELYIADQNVIDVFKLEGKGVTKYVSQFGHAVLGGAGSVAVLESGIEAGSAYVGEPGSGVVDVFGSMGTFEEWTGGSSGKSFGGDGLSVGIDSTSEHLYVSSREFGVVDELEAATPEKFLDALGPFGQPVAVTVSRSDQDVYVGGYNEGNGAGTVEVYGPDLYVPSVAREPKAVPTPEGVELEGTVDPEKLTVTSCVFEYGETTSYGKSVECKPSLAEISKGENGAGEGPVPVTADLKGLPPGTPYHFRLVAGSEHGTNPSDDQTFITVGPKFEGESVSDVASTSATLEASVDPNGAATSAYFEYGPEPCAGAAQACAVVPAAPGEALGAGVAPVTVQPQHVQGLSPGTVYHYRVVGVSTLEVKEVLGPVTFPDPAEGTFTTQTAGERTLPDGRAYELVSPPKKEGALIIAPGEAGMFQAAADGGAMTYLASVPTEPGLPGYSNLQQLFSTRAPAGGWSSVDLAAAHNGAVGGSDNSGQEYRFFSDDLSQGIVQPFGAFEPCENSEGAALPCLSPEASEQTAFVHSDFVNGNPQEPCPTPAERAGGVSCYTPLVTGKPGYANVPEDTVFGQVGDVEGLFGHTCPPAKFCGPDFVGASPNAQHVALESRVQLTPVAVPEGGLYEWNEGAPAGEQLQLVSILPRNGTGEELAAAPPFPLGSHDGEDARGAVSADGSRVFWTNGTGNLYVRDMVKGESLAVGGGGAVFQDASSDGSRVFYAENGSLHSCEIVEVAGRLSCTPELLGEEEGAMLGASEDGSYAYRVAGHVLFEDHLEGGVWQSTRVAGLSGEDTPDWANGGSNLSQLSARVSPDGRWLAFMSDQDLVGYDTDDAVSGHPDEELYVFDAVTGRLACASCDPTGARPTGVEYEQEGKGMPEDAGHEVWIGHNGHGETWLAADVPGFTQYESSPGLGRYQPRYLSNEGRVFFDSDDALVPQDINGTWDVYEYEPEKVPAGGEHPCAASSTSGSVVFKPARTYEVEGEKGESGAGCVGLISSGNSAQESAFLDADEGGGAGEHGKPGTAAGGEVFFMTTAKLAPQDFDKSYDVYDAHECTAASPCIPPPPGAEAECTTAEACRAAPLPEPGIYGAPASATFSGIGDLPAPKPAAVVKKPLTRAQKLADALKGCRKDRRKAKRASCEKAAKKSYGPVKKAKR